MTIRCDCCGSVSDLDESFIKTKKNFRLKKTAYCPQCWADSELESIKSWFWFYGLFLLVIFILWLAGSKEAPRLFSIFLFVVFLSAAIMPHEIGHALVARILGLRVFIIVVGSGRTLKKLQLFGFKWEFKQFPIYGFTVCCAKSARLYRLKRMLVALSGPAVNLGLAATALFAYGSLRMISSWSIPFMPFASFAFANLWMLFINLVPHHHKTAHGKVPSDGLSLLRLPFSSKAEIDENIIFYFALEGLELRKKDQSNEAIQWYQKALSIYPGDTRLLNDYAVALIDSERYEEAKTICSQIIEKLEPNPAVKAIVQNNIAHLNILIGEKALLEEADAASSLAFASCPWIPAIRGTRGMVLVELGRIDEGIRLLKEALERSERARDKALSAACLAIAEARNGNRTRAQQYLETATQYHLDHPLIKRAKAESSNQSLNMIPPVLLSPG